MSLSYLIVYPMVFLAGLVDSIAGGGGLISLPGFMFAGLPVHNAIATNKLCSSMGTTMATWKYARNGFIQLRQVIPCVVTAMLGSSCGARLALQVSDEYFRIIMMLALPVIAFYVLRSKHFDETKQPFPEGKTMVFSACIALVIGVYDGFYGPGTGTFLILLLTGVAHLPLTRANGTTKAINLSTNYAALAVFLLNGKAMILLGLTAGLFNMAGNYIGAAYFTKTGAKSVRPVMLVVLVLFFIKLVFRL